MKKGDHSSQADRPGRPFKPSLVAQIAQLDKTGFVGHYVLVAEVMDEQGSALVVCESEGLPAHTQIGMLESALTRIRVVDTQNWSNAEFIPNDEGSTEDDTP